MAARLPMWRRMLIRVAQCAPFSTSTLVYTGHELVDGWPCVQNPIIALERAMAINTSRAKHVPHGRASMPRRRSPQGCSRLCRCSTASLSRPWLAKDIFCVHGGLSPQLMRPVDVNSIRRPCKILAERNDLLSDLTWSDPHQKIKGAQRVLPEISGSPGRPT